MNNNLLVIGIAALSYLLFQNNRGVIENMVGGSGPKMVSGSDFTVDKQTGNVYLQNATTGAMFAVFANWCIHCKKLKAAVEQAGLKNVYYFDASDNKNPEVQATLSKLKVNSFPTVFKIGSDGLLMSYEGGRSPQELQQNFS